MRFGKYFLLLLLSWLLLPEIASTQDSISSAIDSTAITDTIALDSLESSTKDVTPKDNEVIPFSQKIVQNKFFPLFLFIFLGMCLLLIPLRSMKRSIEGVVNDTRLSLREKYDYDEKIKTYKATLSVFHVLIPVSLLLYLLHVSVVDTMMEGYVKEWLNLLVRWAHVVAGIMWIGASFYFIFLENNLNRTKNIRDELAGNLWAVHGGGFYFLEKYKVAPKKIPKDLHWFKYEAYFTFLTGFALLIIVYYMDAKGYMIDQSVMDLTVLQAIGISLLSIVSGWAIYDLLCKSKLIENTFLFGTVGFLLLAAMAYFLNHVFNPRAAYIHFGAIIGAIMVGNVYFNIIPAQKAMVRSAVIGEPLDASLGKKAGQRSLHNNYFTLPVIFIMISNHFPSTYGHPSNWIILLVIVIASAGIKHYWNLVERGIHQTKLLIISIITLFVLAYVISPAFEHQMDMAIPVSFKEANEVIQTRCVTCHSASPTDDEWKVAPNGVMYDTPEQIKFMSNKIMTRAVRSKNMPLGNKTKMTEEERTILKRWIVQGAKIDE